MEFLYSHLAERYGDIIAYDLLLVIERMAKVKANILADEESRLAHALRVMDAPLTAH